MKKPCRKIQLYYLWQEVVSTNEGQIAESYYNYNPVDIDDLLINPMDLYSGANCSISEVKGVISPAYINLRYREDINPRFYDYYFKVQYWLMAFFHTEKEFHTRIGGL